MLKLFAIHKILKYYCYYYYHYYCYCHWHKTDLQIVCELVRTIFCGVQRWCLLWVLRGFFGEILQRARISILCPRFLPTTKSRKKIREKGLLLPRGGWSLKMTQGKCSTSFPQVPASPSKFSLSHLLCSIIVPTLDANVANQFTV